MNLSAPFIPQFFGAQLAEVLPYCDVIIANEAEACAWATANNAGDPEDLAAVAKAIATSPKANKNPRIAIITHGPKSTVWVSSENPDSPKTHDVTPLKEEEIVDTNGAGDAFAGGFLAGYILGKSIDDSVEVGHKLGRMCVTQVLRYFPVEEVADVLLGWPAIPMAQGCRCLKRTRMILHCIVTSISRYARGSLSTGPHFCTIP